MKLISSEIDLYYCADGCKSVWLNHESRLKFSQLKTLPVEIEESEVDESDTPLTCPNCDISLRRHRCATNLHVFEDECYLCAGVHFRAGVLKELLDHSMNSEQIEAFQMQLLAEVPEYIIEKERIEQQNVINAERSAKWSLFSPKNWFKER